MALVSEATATALPTGFHTQEWSHNFINAGNGVRVNPGSFNHTFDFGQFEGMADTAETRSYISHHVNYANDFLKERSGPRGYEIAETTASTISFRSVDNDPWSTTGGGTGYVAPTLKVTANYVGGVHTFDGTDSDSTFTTLQTGPTVTFGDVSWNYESSKVDLRRYKKDMLSAHMKSNLLIKMKSRHDFLPSRLVTAQEIVARNTLRDMISEKDWRRYVANGFIMVPGVSGKWYQIFNNTIKNVNVFSKGKLIESLCIHTSRECPPTDHAINMKLMIELDESLIWENSNKRGVYNTSVGAESGKRTLLQLAKSINDDGISPWGLKYG